MQSLQSNSQLLNAVLSLEVHLAGFHALLAVVKVVLGFGALLGLLACCGVQSRALEADD